MIHVSNTLAVWWTRRRTLDGRSIGFVPTMGALYRGHSSLVERCRGENQVVVVSIFVNPSQFNDPSDLERYPRTLDQDLEFFLPTQIIPCPTVREDSGLAMSSRNTLLSAEAHDKAAHLFRALTTASSCAEARAVLEAQGFRVEYVEERWARRLAAVNLEGVRLIDNVPVAEIKTQRFLG